MTLEDLFLLELNTVLNVENFILKKDGGGYFAVRKYELGEQIIFFETGKKWDGYFSVDIKVQLTNEPVQKIHSIVNNRNAPNAPISLRLSFLSKKMNNRDANFERKKFNGRFGKYISLETLEQYRINLEECLKNLILPFFQKFENQNSFDNYINSPVLSGDYDFETSPIWKDAITSVIVAKLIDSKDLKSLFKIWFNQDLQKGVGFDTRMELTKLKEILNNIEE
ncbi:hypothetical protein Q4599_00850 [Cellulophaga lytica]|uniref:hypothetical protein n=1 Tax=Cellulophaga lytica TaxID=979 RepID=UPI0026E2FC9D|nr:hypothetical protein [Cellulophaga lytica]MDO6852109.1 hypothetical protein [Cellulophaga lytica]